MDCSACLNCGMVVLLDMRGCRLFHILMVIIIIRQPLCPVVGRRPRHAVSKLPCLVLSSAISCRSSTCPGRLSTVWLVSLVVFSCHLVSIFLSVDSIYDFCPLHDPDVGLSIFICDVEHASFHFGLCGRKFVLCFQIYTCKY